MRVRNSTREEVKIPITDGSSPATPVSSDVLQGMSSNWFNQIVNDRNVLLNSKHRFWQNPVDSYQATSYDVNAHNGGIRIASSPRSEPQESGQIESYASHVKTEETDLTRFSWIVPTIEAEDNPPIKANRSPSPLDPIFTDDLRLRYVRSAAPSPDCLHARTSQQSDGAVPESGQFTAQLTRDPRLELSFVLEATL